MIRHKFKNKNRKQKNRRGSNIFSKRAVSMVLLVAILLGQTGIPGVFEGNLATVMAAIEPETEVPLKRISGSGEGFMYCHFQEVTEFQSGTTYALMDDMYGYEDAVFALGSGAVLKITSDENGSKRYIQNKYGSTAEVKAYVDVITRGRQFDGCVIGGLYQVPDSGTPVEYRYFCGYGGAQNCGPLYAYSYEKGKLSYENISASLNKIERQGSTNSSDYTVILSYEGKSFTLDPKSYTVRIVQPDTVVITAEDSEGNKITTNFTGPLAVRYDGNAEGVTNVPDMQGMWKGEAYTIDSMTPIRSGYAFQNWKDSGTGTVYAPGTKISSMSKSLNLAAQWKDTTKPNVTYQGVQVITHTSDADVKSLVEKALTITDNEPVSECTVTISVPGDIAETAGAKTVTVTVTDKAGNSTTKSCTVDVVARPVEIKNPAFTESTKALSATLCEPGPDDITETGFVWGVMNNPTVTLNNGKASTSSPVVASDSVIKVTADSLQKGVTYYARAYVIAGEVAYYSDEISFGLGLPAYGTFTIKNNNNNTFTVTRSGGSEETQTVYYRTVNGSAVGGTHFTHAAGTLVFNSGETSKTITITETTANTAYGSNGATAYSNADRTYQVELYRVTGGAALGTAATATRTMTAGSSYRVDRTIYTTEKSQSQSVVNKWVTDHTGGSAGDVIWRSDRSQNTNINQDNFNSSRTIDTVSYPNIVNYIKGTAGYYLYRYEMIAHEDEDGWEHAWMGTAAPGNAGTETKCGGSYAGSPVSLTDSVAGNAIWTAVFQVGQGYSTMKMFPTTTKSTNEDTGALGNAVYGYNADSSIVTVDGTCYAKIPVSESVYNYFSACGSNQDRWYVEGFTDYTKIYDAIEPRLLSVAPMADGTYKVGDTFIIALIFDEIVDSSNSPNLSNVFLDTTWGPASYEGGADTNVLYFTGTVEAAAENPLKVSQIVNSGEIKDMCSVSETACGGGSGSTTASVDTATPNFTVVSNGISTGTGTAKITVNTDKTKTSSLKYVWSDTASMPVTGWVEASASELAAAKATGGLALSIRKTPGSGSSNGKWYLHVIGTYAATGAASYQSAVLDFGTVSAPAAGSTALSLTVSADNTNWAKSRPIQVSTAGGGTLKYRRIGETAWTTLTGNCVTVTSNGYYTFTLTGDDQTVTQNIQIEKLDNAAPTVIIGNPAESGTTQTKKDGVYTELTLPVSSEDGESYIAKFEYAWTNSASTPSSGWTSANTSTSQLTYTASESTETTKYLHLRVTDAAGNTVTAKSQAYTLISQTVVDNNTPDITLTGAPTQWTNDMATLTWELTNYTGKNYTVTMSNGTTSTDTQGNFLATQNGTYTVTVLDNDYGGSKTATLTVDKLDFAPPDVSVTGVSTDWKSSTQSIDLDISDSQSGICDAYYKIVSSDSEIPEDGLTAFTDNSNVVDVTENGIWYIYYKIFDNTADTSTGRPANMTEGFAGPILIDTDAPELTIGGGLAGDSALELTLQAAYGISGGNVMVGGTVLSELTASASDGSTGETKNTTYTVTAKGTYTFQVQNGAGYTDLQDVTVYQATFKAQNGTDDEFQLVVENGKLTKPAVPKKGDDTFTGWYTAEEGGSQWDFANNVVTQDMTLYAQWTNEKYKVSLIPGEGCTLTASLKEVKWGGSSILKFALADGYSMTDDFAVKINGEAVTLNNGQYTISDIQEDITVTVEGVADITAPSGEITIGANKWSSFLNTITFGLFFKETQNVTITAEDKGSGLNTTEYYVSDKALTEKEVEGLTWWTSYMEAFKIEPNDSYVIYAKLTDNAGNVTYLSSDGMIIENIAPVVNGITDGAVYCDNVTFTVTEENPDTVTVDGSIVTAVDGTYTITADNKSHTVLAADKAGNTSAAITVTVNDGHTWDEGEFITEPTCTEKGVRIYSCMVCGAAVTEDVEATGHSWGKPVFTWEGFTAATATFTCTTDTSHKEVKDCAVSSRITKAATGTAKGEITYTATVEFENQTYTDTKAQETSKIEEETIGSGTLETEVNVADDVPTVVIEGLTVETAKDLLPEAELKEIETGEDVLIRLEITNINDTVSRNDRALVESCLEEMVNTLVKTDSKLVSARQVKTGILYLDLSLFKRVGSNSDTKIYSTNGKMLTINVEISEELKSDTGKRTYTVIRVHGDGNGNVIAEPLSTIRNEDDLLTFKTDRFSTYAIVYTEKDLAADAPVKTEDDDNQDNSEGDSNNNNSDRENSDNSVSNQNSISQNNTSQDSFNPAAGTDNRNNKSDNAPKTGDSNKVWLWMLFLVVDLGVFGAAAIGYRRRKTANK